MPASDAADPDTLEHLLHAAGRGDRQAFAKVYAQAAPTLFAIALRMARQRPLAEEVLQDAFLSIWRKAGQYHPDRGQAMAWMIAVVRNRAIDRLRSEGRSPTAAAVPDGESAIEAHSAAFEPALPRDMAESVRGCVERLQNNYRRSILLAYYYGLTHEELAARLDAPLGTVKSWVRRGILQLRECLEE